MKISRPISSPPISTRMLRGWRRWLLPLLAVLVACLLLVPAPAHAQEELPYRVYHGQRVPLNLDAQHLAVRLATPAGAATSAGGGSAPTLPAGLAARGFTAANVVAQPLPGWVLLDARGPLGASATGSVATAGVRQLINELLASDPTIEFASPVFRDERGGPLLVTATVLIGFEKTLSGTERERLRLAVVEGAAPLKVEFPQPHDARWGIGSRDGFAVLARANALAESPGVLYAEPDMISTGYSDLVPNDASFSQSWGLRNTGQSGGLAGFDMGATGAWDITLGASSVIVLVLDSGVQQDHPDINQRAGRDFTSDAASNPNGGPFGVNDNHATAVAGCISERINNSVGTAGIAPGVLVASARTYNNYQSSGSFSFTYSWVVDALNWGQSIGARVSNNSNYYGGTSSAIESAYASTRTNGMVHFASAGNDGTGTIGYPSSIPSVNSVAAADRTGQRASFSQYGTGLKFTAPGQAILSTDRTGTAGYTSTDYATVDGTSFASPYAAGVAALVISRNPGFTAAQVESRMQTTCTDMGPAGYDTGYGYGLVNALRALGGTATPAPANDTFSNATALSGTAGSTTGTNVNATKETGEPNHGGNTGGKSVWYRWTAPATGPATFDTFGSNFDTLLGVYSGSSVGALTTVAGSDDAGGTLQSQATFNAVAGTSYAIAVDGYGGDSGNIALHWTSSGSRNDFNGDGKPDLIWENDTSGFLVAWFMNGSGLISQTQLGPIPQVDPAWKIRGTGDFNGDGRPDLVWENDNTGQLVVWLMNGTSLVSQTTFSPYNQVDPSWKVMAVTDLNGDGRPDLVWENEISGQLVYWVLNGTALNYQGTFSPYDRVDPSWRIVGAGDFDGDGKPDLVWENLTSGQLVLWVMNGTVLNYQTSFTPYPQVDPAWKIRSVADFNGDGKPDLVWENDNTGFLVLWYLNGTSLLSQTQLSPYPQVDPTWKIRSR